ncbi:MAG TPA: alpha/beta hydrolase [Acidimicrobiales bacterium]|nr:alpha/beta hydrolase [Acidimicrobiales bacterium]
MNLAPEVRSAAGTDVHLIDRPGRPLLLTMRMAAVGMNVWSKVWPSLADEFTVATFNLPVPDTWEFDDPAAMFDRLADRVVEVAEALGHPSFHYLASTSGTRIGLHLLARHQDRLESCVLYDPVYTAAERRSFDRLEDIWETLLRQGGLEAYTWWWMLYSFTPRYAEEHYDELAAMVQRRLEADAVRGLDADKVVRWNKVLSAPTVGDSDLQRVRVPTLVVGTSASAHLGRHLTAKLPTAQFTAVPLGGFGMYEDPDTFLAAVRPFLTAARTTAPEPGPERPGRVVGRSGHATALTEGRPTTGVVMLHGWLMSPAMWDAQTAAMAQAGVRAVALAQPGHAGSAAPPSDLDMALWAELSHEALEELGLDRFVLIGHSMGGMLALAMAAARPERIAGLGLVGTTDEAWPQLRRDEFLQLASAVSAGWGTELAPQVASVLLGERFLRSQPAWLGRWTTEVARYDLAGMMPLARAVAGRPDQTDVLGRLEVPVLIVHGDDDRAVDVEHGRRMAGRSAKAELCELPQVGHCPPLEAPETVNRALVPFALEMLGSA